MDYDVLICGGGTAGSVAGIAAARQGAKTFIVEQFGFLGGSQTAALVLPLMQFTTGGMQLVRGLHQEIMDRCDALGGGNESTFFNPELLKYVLEDMVLESGCEVLYHTFVSNAVLHETGPDASHSASPTTASLGAIEVVNKSGKRWIEARQFVDCTGDADVAALARAPFESGRPEDGLNQSASLRFLMGGVDCAALVEFLHSSGHYATDPKRFDCGFAKGVGENILGTLMAQAEADGVISSEVAGYLQFFSIPGRPGELAFNCPRVTHINGAKAEDLTQVQLRGRKSIPQVIEFCKRYLPGFDNAYLSQTAPMPGIRESRRIVGEYTLTAEDFYAARKFDDGIAKSCYGIDVHNPSGGGVKMIHMPEGDWQEIPYRCLVPQRVDNLLVAGRCISASFEAQAAIRIEPTCRAMGEAAGVAAALCARDGVAPRALDVGVLLEELRRLGAEVGGEA